MFMFKFFVDKIGNGVYCYVFVWKDVNSFCSINFFDVLLFLSIIMDNNNDYLN